MTALTIAPLPDPILNASQDSVGLEIGSIIVQFAEISSEGKETPILATLIQPPQVTDAAIDALEQLIQLLQQLRSTHPRSLEEGCLTAEDFLPYGIEEALDVLAALQTDSSPVTNSSLTSPLIRLESLVTPILWAIARSAYPVMELLEGTGARTRLPGQSWTAGGLRLVPLLEISTPDQYWRFDLTTGQQPQPIPDLGLQIQLEKALFPDVQLHFQSQSGTTAHSATQHLQHLQQALSVSHPGLQVLFQGLPIYLLPPGSPWLQGELKLNLEFEWMAQDLADGVPERQPFQGNCVEGELVDEQAPETGRTASGLDSASVPLAVVEIPALLEPGTLIRIADPDLLAELTETVHRQVMEIAIAPLHPLIQTPASSDPILAVIRSALSLEPREPHSVLEQLSQQNFSLLQPELLLDEVVPKLLWQLSRSAYSVMQWIGGRSATLLQPDRPWETGILRLMPVLSLSGGDRTGSIDLTTGCFIPEKSWWQVNPNAVVMVLGDSGVAGRAVPNTLPLKLATVLAELLPSIQATAPEIALLQDAIAIEWLTSEQTWQSGQLVLQWGFDWMPEID